jgi:hypothetical protein
MEPKRTSPSRRGSAPAAAQPGAGSLAGQRRAAMSLRARRIRRRVAGMAAAVFTVAFLAVYVQLASGHDPALSSRTSTAAKASSTTSTSSGSTSSSGASESSGSSSATESGTTASSPSTSKESSGTSSGGEESSSPVTTSQS